VLEHRALEDKYNTFVLLEQQISELEAVSAEAGFWDDNVVASQKLQQVNDFKTSRSAKRRICRGAGFSSWVDHGGARGQAAQHPVRYRAAAGKVLRAPQRRRDRRGRGHRLQQYHLACARASEPCLAEGARGPYRSDRHPLHW
jgi:autonomous glycyl radical cofactor GrcA